MQVVNVFDISLIGRAPVSNDVETPEGNGTGKRTQTCQLSRARVICSNGRLLLILHM